MQLNVTFVAAIFSALLPTSIQSQVAAVTGRVAWTMPSEYKAIQAQALRGARRLLLAMTDSMPEQFYRDRATPPQRDFAQQVGFAAGEAYRVGAFAAGIGSPPPAGDTTVAFASRGGLRAYVSTIYDRLDDWLAKQSDGARNERIDFFGTDIPRWLAWDEIAGFTTWTEGQLVANFRKHGMAPPGYMFFDPRQK